MHAAERPHEQKTAIDVSEQQSIAQVVRMWGAATRMSLQRNVGVLACPLHTLVRSTCCLELWTELGLQLMLLRQALLSYLGCWPDG